jgi:PPOX class probable F420-dependent enzyme
MSRRDQIRMTPDEVLAFFDAQKVINVATIGRNGRPHVAPLWYVPQGGTLTTWTYGNSQKVANLRRLPEATVLIEDGDSYETLRGVSLEADVEILEDTEAVATMGLALMQRYSGAEPGAEIPEEAAAMVRAQAAKRVGLVFTPTKTVTWDHRKLGGTY